MSTRKRRLYFILPDVPTTRQVVDELLLARVEERHMHTLGPEGTDLGDLPEADLFQRTDIVHGTELGLVTGGLTGIAVGLFVAWLYTPGIAAGGGIILGIALVGALVGAWASGMVAASIPNTRIEPFEGHLQAGHILLMVDIPEDRLEEIRGLVRKHHPEAEDHGPDPTTPAFP